MAIEIAHIGPEELDQYAAIPISYQVASVLHLEAVEGGLGGFRLIERAVDPYLKDYDVDGSPEARPLNWPKRFDVHNWAFLLARVAGEAVAAATVAYDTPSVHMLEGRRDLAVLWDLRVHPDHRGQALGTQLFQAAVAWAKRKGCRQLKVETQNTNLPACRFYAKQGCYLGAIHRYAYRADPEVAHEVQLCWYLDL